MTEPEFGLTDLDILKETYDNIGVEYEENFRYNPISYLNPDEPRLVVGYSIDLDLSGGEAELSHLFDMDGKFIETTLWTSW